MTTKRKYPLLRLTDVEANAIEEMFRLYDYKATGKIPRHLAIKLFKGLGFDLAEHTVPLNGGFRELLMFLDRQCPDPLPSLNCSLYTFTKLAAKTRDEETGQTTITPQNIADFMESLGRPPCSLLEADLLLTSMLEYDNCEPIPQVLSEYFSKEVTNIAKKTNAMKDFR